MATLHNTLFPPEQLFKPFQVSHQRLDCWEIRHIDIGMWRSQCAHVSSGEDYGDCVLTQHLEELLCDVVLAHGVLKGEVELIVVTEQIMAPFSLPLGAVEVPTVAIDVDRSEIVNHVDQVLPAHCGLTV